MIFGCNSTSEKVNRSLFRHCSKMWVVLCTRVVKTSVLLMSVGHCFIGNYSNNEWLFLSNTILKCWVEIESRPCIFPFDVIFISLWKPFAIDDLVSAWLITRSSSRMMIWRNKQVLLNCGQLTAEPSEPIFFCKKKNHQMKVRFRVLKKNTLFGCQGT